MSLIESRISSSSSTISLCNHDSLGTQSCSYFIFHSDYEDILATSNLSLKTLTATDVVLVLHSPFTIQRHTRKWVFNQDESFISSFPSPACLVDWLDLKTDSQTEINSFTKYFCHISFNWSALLCFVCLRCFETCQSQCQQIFDVARRNLKVCSIFFVIFDKRWKAWQGWRGMWKYRQSWCVESSSILLKLTPEWKALNHPESKKTKIILSHGKTKIATKN